MRASPAALIAVLALAACQGHSQQARGLAPLEDEAEVYVYLQPFPASASRLNLSVASVALLSQDGTTVPLQLLAREVFGSSRTQRLVAHGRVPPGYYGGVEVQVARATLGADERSADLVVADTPAAARVSIAAASGRAAVVWLGLRSEGRSPETAAEFAPAFSAELPASPLAPLVGYCSSPGMNHLALFDKRSRQVVGVVPTGRGPRGVAIDERTGRAYVAVSDDDEVEVVDFARGDVVGRVRLDPGDAPRDVALTPDGKLLVVLNPGSRTASFVDPLAIVERGRVPVGEEPTSLALDRASRRAYVFNSRSSTVTVLDLANRAVVGTVATEGEPLGGDLDRAGNRLYVIHRGSPFMSVLSIPDLALLNRVFVGLGATAVRVDRRTDLVYVASGPERRLQVYDPFSFVPLHAADVPGAVSSMVIDDVGNTLFSLVPSTRSVAVVDLASMRTVTTIDVGDGPFDVALAGERR